jgi:hypothetical protein
LVNFAYIVSHNIRSHVAANIIGIVVMAEVEAGMNDLQMISKTTKALMKRSAI